MSPNDDWRVPGSLAPDSSPVPSPKPQANGVGPPAPPATATSATPVPRPRGKSNEPVMKDAVREVVETVVFVVVLVLLLKTFVAEAFVIPTGSMAETLYGYQKLVTCPKCKWEFPVNCSFEVDPQQGESPTPAVGCTCPNC